MWEIRDGTKLLARGGQVAEFPEGKHFLSQPMEQMQYAVYRLNDGELSRHIHKPRNRQGKYPTNEFFVVLSGCLEVSFYSENRTGLASRRQIISGGFFCQHTGGHGFKIIEPETVFIEVKHGPFTAVEDDKEKF